MPVRAPPVGGSRGYSPQVRILIGGSWITVICALLTGLWSVPQFLITGTVALSSHPLFLVLFLFPAQVGVPVSLLTALNSILMASRRRLVTPHRRLLAGGQVLTVGLLLTCALLLLLPTAFGREFIVMALAYQIGQVVVAIGLLLYLLQRRKWRRADEATRARTSPED